jgi:hypothetical protein
MNSSQIAANGDGLYMAATDNAWGIYQVWQNDGVPCWRLGNASYCTGLSTPGQKDSRPDGPTQAVFFGPRVPFWSDFWSK